MKIFLSVIFALLLAEAADAAQFLRVPMLRCPAGTWKLVLPMTRQAKALHLEANCAPVKAGDKTPGDFFPALPPQIDTYSVVVDKDQGIPTEDCIVIVPARIAFKGMNFYPGSSGLTRGEALAEIAKRTKGQKIDIEHLEELP